jgi:uncharacterized protein with GYD domain
VNNNHQEKGNNMTRYISLLRFTDKGASALKNTTTRAAGFCAAAKKAGVKIEAQLWTTGACDGVLILSGDEKKILRCLAQLVAQGNVRTETLRAFDSDEMRSVVS